MVAKCMLSASNRRKKKKIQKIMWKLRKYFFFLVINFLIFFLCNKSFLRSYFSIKTFLLSTCRCKLRNLVGTILSREVLVRGGMYINFNHMDIFHLHAYFLYYQQYVYVGYELFMCMAINVLYKGLYKTG